MLESKNNQTIQVIIDSYNEKLSKKLGQFEDSKLILSRYYYKSFNDKTAKFTVVMPICNQESIIENILKSLFENISISSNLIFVLDACTDKSEEILVQHIMNNFENFPLLLSVMVLTSKKDIFEATCENIALSLTETQYFMSIQADIYLNDISFQKRALSALEQNQDLAGVSAKAVLPFSDPRKKPLKHSTSRFIYNIKTKLFKKGALKLGNFGSREIYFGDVSVMPKMQMKFTSIEMNNIYLGEAIIRGPIVWRTSPLKKLGGINDVAFFLGWDDYDLSWRLWSQYRLRVGYLPAYSYSIPNTGTNSKARNMATEAQYSIRKQIAALNPGELSKLWELIDKNNSIEFPKIEKRRIKQDREP
jgi:hypothetical protein